VSIPFVDLKQQYRRLKPLIDRRIQAVLDHGQYILGPEVAALERALADFCGVRHAVAVSSGTDALIVPLMAWGLGPGDAVFVPAFTYTATAEAILLLGASPVFVDVDRATFLIDPADLERRLAAVLVEGRLRPRAIMPVDLFGFPADYDAIARIAAAHDLHVIADAAQSFGAAHGNRRVGALAPVTATSFYPAKPLGCYGDGGAIFTDDDDLAALFRSIRVHGEGTERYDVARVGLNARMDTIQAAVLLAKLPTFPDELAARETLSRRYDTRLANAVAIPARPAGAMSAWAQYTIRSSKRDAVRAALAEAGIPSVVYYPRPMHLQPAYRAHGGGEGTLPVSEALCREVLSLPMHPFLSEADADRVCAAICVAV
jgi:UDP-2-acetamido-2-deoxy-ribo-hexuluronate aminotransferase